VNLRRFGYLAVIILLTWASTAAAAGSYLEVSYPPSTEPG